MSVAKTQALGMSLPEIAEACKTITPNMGAVKLRRGINGLNIIDSMYSANPDGVIAALEYLKVWPDKKVIVMPCLIELGKVSKAVHKRIGEKIAEVCDLAIITTKDRFDDIKEGGGGSEKIVFIENPTSIIKKIKSTTQPGDVVLLEGRVPKELFKLLYV
jgi:UDP-N-acetylmuramyl pentapeptide synthase